MKFIKEIYINDVLKTDFKTILLVVDGEALDDSVKFNILSYKILDLNQNEDFNIKMYLNIINEAENEETKIDGKLSNTTYISINDKMIEGIVDSKINGISINEKIKIELYLDSIKIKEPNIKIVIDINKNNLLKYTRI